MSATKAPPKRPRLTRDQAADRIYEVLGDEPLAGIEVARHILGSDATRLDGVVRDGLSVLESTGRAKRIARKGWARIESPHEANVPESREIKFSYKPKMVRLDEMFVDRDYQRPLTSFWAKIKAEFNEDLFQPICLSDRGPESILRYAIMDGQTRWKAGTDLGIVEAPANVYTGLSIEEEARLFSRLQTQRKGMVSWHRFRADLKAGEPMQLAIRDMAEMIGFTLGEGEGELKAVGALESGYKQDPFVLERTLIDLREAWPDEVPEGKHIRGVHYFLRNYPIGEKSKKLEVIDDTKLINRLRTMGPNGLIRKMDAAKEMHRGASNAKLMGLAIQNVYETRGHKS